MRKGISLYAGIVGASLCVGSVLLMATGDSEGMWHLSLMGGVFLLWSEVYRLRDLCGRK